jgi:hypothetical protein
MRTALLAVVCLAVGILGTFGYSHYLGEGKQLADVQAELDSTKAVLAKATQQSHDAKSETDAMSAQIQQLTATKQDLTHQLDQLKTAAAPTPPVPTIPGFNGSSMAGIVKAQLASRSQEKFQRLISRLHLTPDQEAAVKAAMDAEDKRTDEATTKMLSGG